MSWPGEQYEAPEGHPGAQPPSSPGGRGRRRRADNPAEQAEDDYGTGEYQYPASGRGRRGTGEFARPAEYQDYSRPVEYTEPPRVEYAEPSYVRYDPYGQASYQPQPQSYTQQEPYSYGNDPYASSGYDSYSAPQQDLNSSGFYQATQPPPPVAPPVQAVPVAEVPQPAVPVVPHQQSPQSSPFSVHEPAFTAASAQPSEPAPVFTPDPDPASTSASPSASDEEDVSGWLNFVESRADLRAERSRRFRLQMIALCVVVAVAAVAGGLWFLLGGGGGTKATQTTVLFQLRDAQGNGVGNAVLVADRNAVAGQKDTTGRGAALLIPSQLTVETLGLESQPFGGAMPSVPPAGKDAVSGLLGIDVDGVWGMDVFSFAALINNLTDVTVDVDTAVQGPDGKTVIPAGRAELDGTKAVVYATYRAPGEPPSKQLARFGQVLSATLAKIPAHSSTTLAILNELATVPDPALPNDRLAAILTALGGEAQGNRFSESSLPLRSDGSGALDLAAASPVVKQLLGGAVHSKDEGGLSRVAITDATGRLDIQSSKTMAASKLLGGGYTTIDSGGQQAAPTSSVEVPGESSRQLGEQIATTLGLPTSAVKVTPFDPTLVDAIVVLGQDWSTVGDLPPDSSPTPTAPVATASGPAPGATSPAGGAATPTPHATKPTPTSSRR